MLAERPILVDHAHRGAILDAEARRLARLLTSYGVLTRHQLAELSGAQHWSNEPFEQALEHAQRRGLIRHVAFDFYAPGSGALVGRPRPKAGYGRSRRNADAPAVRAR